MHEINDSELDLVSGGGFFYSVGWYAGQAVNALQSAASEAMAGAIANMRNSAYQ